MGLEYDFDIKKGRSDFDETEQEVPAATDDGRAYAAFRNIKTADALRGASPKIRQMFLDAGFGLDVHQSGIAPGVYPMEDVEDRNRILRNLFANIRERGVQGEYSGEFDLGEFLNQVRQARPHAGVARVPETQRESPEPAPASTRRRTVPSRIGLSLGLAVVLFAVLKYLADAGAAAP